MPDIDENISESLEIRPEDYGMFLRALWQNAQEGERRIQNLQNSVEQLSGEIKDINEILREIRNIFVVGEYTGNLIKWMAMVVAPIVLAGFGAWSYLKGHKIW